MNRQQYGKSGSLAWKAANRWSPLNEVRAVLSEPHRNPLRADLRRVEREEIGHRDHGSDLPFPPSEAGLIAHRAVGFGSEARQPGLVARDVEQGYIAEGAGPKLEVLGLRAPWLCRLSRNERGSPEAWPPAAR